MAITGIDTIDGKQIIAAGAVSAKSAEMAYNDENGNPITGYLTAVPEGYATTGDLTAYQTTAGMTAYQSAGDYLSANALDDVSGDWNRISALSGYSANGWSVSPTRGRQVFAEKVIFSPQAGQNISAYLGVYSSGASTASDIYTYITDAGSIYLYNKNRSPSAQFIRPDTIVKWNNYASGKLNTTASANFYTTANESGFISAVPAGTMNESAFEYDENNKISGYNGSAFAGGSDVPEGVMVESGLEYNAVNEISGYNGSAIAQYGAEKQWLVHDDTLVHASNSAQYALGVNLSAVAQLLGVDETVLWESDNGMATSATMILSDYPSAFKAIDLYCKSYERIEVKRRLYYSGSPAPTFQYAFGWNQTTSNNSVVINSMNYTYNSADNSLVRTYGSLITITGSTITNAAAHTGQCGIIKIVGIGRRNNT